MKPVFPPTHPVCDLASGLQLTIKHPVLSFRPVQNEEWMNTRRMITGLLALTATASISLAQDVVVFDESRMSRLHSTSWGFMNAPSHVELADEIKIPISQSQSSGGNQSLRLTWKSAPGGHWGVMMSVMSSQFNLHDFISLDFDLYTEEAMTASELPVVFFDDVLTARSQPVQIPGGDLPAKSWKRISIPATAFISNTGQADPTAMNGLFFGQNQADNTPHTLFIDRIVLTRHQPTQSGAVSAPSGLVVTGYPRHLDLAWKPDASTSVKEYRIYREDGGQFFLLGTAPKDIPFFVHWVGQVDSALSYAVSTVSTSNVESAKTTVETGTTRDLTDDEWLDMVQKHGFRFFWEYAHPVSGLARERLGSGNTCTTGGSGFGIMAFPAAVERGFITRQEAVSRLTTITGFLQSAVTRYHGVWPHWFNGSTGATIPFSTDDNGGDLVESAFLIQGLLACRQYFDGSSLEEQALRVKITTLWEAMEWDWYRRTSDSNVLYWHWSPTVAWKMNFALKGWNETLITYVLGAASPTHPIPASLYDNGFATGDRFGNGRFFYSKQVAVGWDWGGPLFFAHYSFLGLNPKLMRDQYTKKYSFSGKYTWYDNLRNTVLIHQSYAKANPKKHPGYNETTWGLTASDNPWGYSAHEPQANDNGTITPTAGLASFPYTPTESMALLKNLYFTYGDRLYGVFGFTDAFNVKENWFAESIIAIDQGPIVVMIENHRSGLLWNLLMSSPEIKPALKAMGFEESLLTPVEEPDPKAEPGEFRLNSIYPNPFNPETTIEVNLPKAGQVHIWVSNVLGQSVATVYSGSLPAGRTPVIWKADQIASGYYIVSSTWNGQRNSLPVILAK